MLSEDPPAPSKWKIDFDEGVGFNVLYVATWSYLGVLARRSLENLCDQQPDAADVADEAVIYQLFLGGSLWNGSGFLLANIVGSFIMGAMTKIQPLVSSRNPYLYVGISTGFCGCLTTFATWNQNLSVAAASSGFSSADPDIPRHELASKLKALRWFELGLLLWVHFMMFYSSLLIGQIIGGSVMIEMYGLRLEVEQFFI